MTKFLLHIPLLVGLLLVPAPAWADFQAGMNAHNRGDYETALREFQPLADKGNAEALFEMGRIYLYGWGVAQDSSQAVRLFRLAAKKGDSGAVAFLATMYELGWHVQKDSQEAEWWSRILMEHQVEKLQPDAEEGEKFSQWLLGTYYQILKKHREAIHWFERAAEQGDSKSQRHLAWIYVSGLDVPQNYTEAARWYRMLAADGDAESQYKLGGMYALGQGVPQDYVLAHMWSNLAAAQGIEEAAENRAEIEVILTRTQIAEAQRLAREWKAKSK